MINKVSKIWPIILLFLLQFITVYLAKDTSIFSLFNQFRSFKLEKVEMKSIIDKLDLIFDISHNFEGLVVLTLAVMLPSSCI